MTPDQRQKIEQALGTTALTDWEREFLSGISNSDDSYSLTPKQQAALERIAKKASKAA
jgi:hypothetical protein